MVIIHGSLEEHGRGMNMTDKFSSTCSVIQWQTKPPDLKLGQRGRLGVRPK